MVIIDFSTMFDRPQPPIMYPPKNLSPSPTFDHPLLVTPHNRCLVAKIFRRIAN